MNLIFFANPAICVQLCFGVFHMNQPIDDNAKIVFKIPGDMLKYVCIARVEFENQKIDISKCEVTVLEERDSISVFLADPSSPDDLFGPRQTRPWYSVEIRKNDLRIIRSSYCR